MKILRLLFCCTIVLPAFYAGIVLLDGSMSYAQTIKKCKDAQGKWHYGDFASEECERSKITEINSKGIKVRERGLPPTKEEQEAKRAELVKRVEDQKRAKAQQKIDNRLLSTYENEQSIIDARDRRLAAIDAIIKSNNKFDEALNSTLLDLEKQSQARSIPEKRAKKLTGQIAAIKDQLVEYDMATEAKLKERTEIEEHYNNERLRYRQILENRAKLRGSKPGS
ncbi:hypothetical protein ACFL17_00670 [Pseudomonadota bacterium]